MDLFCSVGSSVALVCFEVFICFVVPQIQDLRWTKGEEAEQDKEEEEEEEGDDDEEIEEEEENAAVDEIEGQSFESLDDSAEKPAEENQSRVKFLSAFTYQLIHTWLKV